MIKKVLAILVGLGLLGLVYKLGVMSLTDPSYVLYFGLASAIIAPVGLSLIGYSFKRNDQHVLAELAKVPEIDKLTKEAKSQEEKIALLEQERAKLAEIVRLEARKQALSNRKELLESDAVRILEELRLVDEEITQLDRTVEASSVTEEVRQLQERIEARKKGDIVVRLGSRYFVLTRRLINSLPFPLDEILILYVRLISSLISK